MLVSEDAEDLDGLPEGAIVLTGALRRRAQILMRRPDLRVEPIRGNVDTRLRKWRDTKAGGVILAGAGLNRLALHHLPVYPVPPEVMLPAPGQGTLALQVRAGGMAATLCQVLNDPDTARSAEAERRVVAAFGGDCTLPLGAWARPWQRRPSPPDRAARHPGRPPLRPRRSRGRHPPGGRRRLRGGDAGERGGRGAGTNPGVRVHLRIVVTRAEHQSAGLAAAFETAGATVEVLPLLEVVPPADPLPLERAAAELFIYDWVVFTSANAVEAFLPIAGPLPPL